jgi:hypothetical protein
MHPKHNKHATPPPPNVKTHTIFSPTLKIARMYSHTYNCLIPDAKQRTCAGSAAPGTGLGPCLLPAIHVLPVGLLRILGDLLARTHKTTHPNAPSHHHNTTHDTYNDQTIVTKRNVPVQAVQPLVLGWDRPCCQPSTCCGAGSLAQALGLDTRCCWRGLGTWTATWGTSCGGPCQLPCQPAGNRQTVGQGRHIHTCNCWRSFGALTAASGTSWGGPCQLPCQQDTER